MTAQRFPARLSEGVRRVTTGIDAHGKAVVVADERVVGDERALVMWQADSPPVQGVLVQPPVAGWWPPPGGVRVSLSSRAPDRAADGAPPPHPQQAWPDINDAAGFHASRSTDVVIVIAGRIWCELDDGVEVSLSAGDVLVQNGTRHRWRNRSEEWPILAVFIIGTREEQA